MVDIPNTAAAPNARAGSIAWLARNDLEVVYLQHIQPSPTRTDLLQWRHFHAVMAGLRAIRDLYGVTVRTYSITTDVSLHLLNYPDGSTLAVQSDCQTGWASVDALELQPKHLVELARYVVAKTDPEAQP